MVLETVRSSVLMPWAKTAAVAARAQLARTVPRQPQVHRVNMSGLLLGTYTTRGLTRASFLINVHAFYVNHGRMYKTTAFQFSWQHHHCYL